MTKEQFYYACEYSHTTPTVVNHRIHTAGNTALRRALDECPELETELILRIAVKKPALLDSIMERACIRWSDGYSDSLYSAVMCNIQLLGETIERDENGRIILKPKTDWGQELDKYR